jgi:2-polyprenyl-3-methyl-5-hydroxy-6-metoxy-1,4-benzoquinol methylase
MLEMRQRCHRSLIKQLEALVPRGPRSLLDVECADGTFLQCAAGFGWHVAGTGMSPRGIELLHDHPGFHAYGGQLPEIDFSAPDSSARCFTAIRLNHVLEYSHHPAHDLEVCRGILETHGVLLLTVTNAASLIHHAKNLASRLRLTSRPWQHYTAAYQFYFFTPDALARLLERSGFEVLRWQTRVAWHRARDKVLHQLYRALLEFPRWADELDVFARPT